MPSFWLLFTCVVCVIASALVAGVFQTFSDFVMRALDRSSTAAGIEVMQVINREVYKTVFMFLLLGMSALSAVLILYAAFIPMGAASNLIITGGLIYLVGSFAVTVAFNVPMNTHLDSLDYNSAEAAAYWAKTYYPDWTFWNHIRTIASASAALCYLAACIALAPTQQIL